MSITTEGGIRDLNKIVELMEGCPLDEMHEESSLSEHIELVAEYGTNLFERDLIDDECIKNILSFAMALHDVGRLETTSCNVSGRVSVKDYVSKSCHIAYDVIKRLDGEITSTELNCIYFLIKHQKAPFRNFTSSFERDRDIITTGYEVPLDLLYYVIEADIMGRKSNVKDFMLFKLIEFKKRAIELGTWYDRYKFSDDYSKYLYLSGSSTSRIGKIYDTSLATCTLLCGLPGSKLEEYANNNVATQGLDILSPLRSKQKVNINRVESAANHLTMFLEEKIKSFARSNTDFIYCSYELSDKKRKNLIDKLAAKRIVTNIIFVDKPISTILESLPETKHRSVYNALLKFEPPSPSSCCGFVRVEK